MDATKPPRIAALAVPDATWSVLEVGPGTGALTEALAERAAEVRGVEADGTLARATAERFADRPHVHIEQGDARELDYGALGLRRPMAVAGNIPYHLTGILIERVLEADPRPDRVTFLVQLEVAQRLAAEPGGRDYGTPTVMCGAAWRVRKALSVPRGCFHPVPKVDSAVVVFEPLERPLCPREAWGRLRALVRGAFEHRRKTLRNALRHGGFGDEALAALETVPGVRWEARPEAHGIEVWGAMACRLRERGL